MARKLPDHRAETTEPPHLQREDYYRALFHESRDAFYITTRDGDFVDLNPAGCALLGISPNNMHQHNALDFYAHSEDREYFQKSIETAGEVREYEVALKRTDGQEILCVLSSRIIRDDSGEISGYQGLIRDVSEIRAAEKALRDAHEDLKATLASIPDFTFVIGRDGTILEVHSVQEAALLLPPSDIIGKRVEDIMPPESAGIVMRGLNDAEQGGSVSGVHYSLVMPDGVHWYELSVAVRRGEQADDKRLIASTRDITDRIHVQEALRDSEQRFRSIFEDASVGIALADRDGYPRTANGAFQNLLGYSLDELQGMSFSEFAHRDDRQENLVLWNSLLQGEVDQYDMEKRYIHRDGSEIWLNMRVSRYPGGRNDKEFAIVMVEDISERKRAEQAERDQRVFAEALRDTAEVLSSTLDLDEVFELILQNAARVVPHDFADIMLFEEGEARIVKSRGYLVGHQERLANTRLSVEETRNLQEIVTSLAPIIIPDIHHYEGWIPEISPLNADQARAYLGAPINRDGKVVGVIGLISATPGFFQPEHAERLLAFANQASLALHNASLYQQLTSYVGELAARNNELDAFSYTVAHDLKSPLQIVLGYTTFLVETLNDEMDPILVEPLQSISRYATQMNRLIESLLLMAQLGRDHPDMKAANMEAVISAAHQRTAPIIEKRGVAIILPQEYPSVIGYEPWLEDVIANLLENAVKYMGDENSAPAIEVRAVCSDRLVRYEVRDNGVGIPAEAHPRLFQEFARFHQDIARGSGLGLSIVKRIITKLDGEVGADDIPGGGTCFWFALPASS